jgi:hypothetical protein
MPARPEITLKDIGLYRPSAEKITTIPDGWMPLRSILKDRGELGLQYRKVLTGLGASLNYDQGTQKAEYNFSASKVTTILPGDLESGGKRNLAFGPVIIIDVPTADAEIKFGEVQRSALDNDDAVDLTGAFVKIEKDMMKKPVGVTFVTQPREADQSKVFEEITILREELPTKKVAIHVTRRIRLEDEYKKVAAQFNGALGSSQSE